MDRPGHRHIRLRIRGGRRTTLRGLPAVAALVVFAALGALLIAFSAVVGLLLLAAGVAATTLGALRWALGTSRRSGAPVASTATRRRAPLREPAPSVRDAGARHGDRPARRPEDVEVIEIDDAEVLGPEGARDR